jgi:DNA primase
MAPAVSAKPILGRTRRPTRATFCRHLVREPLLRCERSEAGNVPEEAAGQREDAKADEDDEVKTLKRRVSELEQALDASAQSLAGLVQWGVVELHPWGSRTPRLDRPDRLLLGRGRAAEGDVGLLE